MLSTQDQSVISDNMKDVIRALFAAISDGDFDAAARLVDPDGTAWELKRRDTRPLAEYLDRIHEVWRQSVDGVRFRLGIMTAEEDRVAVTAENHADFPDGRVYENAYHFLFRVRDGLVVQAWMYNDTAHGNEIFGRDGIPEGYQRSVS